MTFPVNAFAAVEIEQEHDTRVSRRRLFRYRNAGNKSPFWAINLTTPMITKAEGMGLSAYLDSLQGALTIFTIKNPLPAIQDNPNSFVSATASSGTNQITVSTPGDCVAGDFIRPTNSPKVYRVVQGALGSGVKNIVITPRLMVDITSVPLSMQYGSEVDFQVCLVNRSGGEFEGNREDYTVIDAELIEQL